MEEPEVLVDQVLSAKVMEGLEELEELVLVALMVLQVARVVMEDLGIREETVELAGSVTERVGHQTLR